MHPATPMLQAQAGWPASRGPALARHLRDCERARGRWFEMRCLVEHLHSLVAPRFCTTVFVAAGLIGLLAMWV